MLLLPAKFNQRHWWALVLLESSKDCTKGPHGWQYCLSLPTASQSHSHSKVAFYIDYDVAGLPLKIWKEPHPP